MAYKTIPIYNLDAPVGAKKANRADDVKLVQSLLRLAMTMTNGAVFETPQVTGIFDDTTRIAIVAFQQWAGEVQNVKRDDVVDPMPAKGLGVDVEAVAPNGHVYNLII